MIRQVIDFLTNMDGRRWRTAVVTALLLVLVAAIFMIGKSTLGVEVEAGLETWLKGFQVGPIGFLATIVVFCLSAFLGVPQFLLIAVCVVAFGPWWGFVYSWVATIVSAGFTYWLGRGPTARMAERYGGSVMARLKAFIGQNVFYASFIIRNVPSAPFIVVNMAFGAARSNFWAFLSGCALGVLPKTALVAFFGGAVFSAVSGDGVWHSLILAGLAIAWLALMLVVREWIRRRRARAAAPRI